jgi:DNA helicase-2/ATP-dependent DNA helicase PcrA
MTGEVTSNASIDDHVDQEIGACLNITAPRSFFLFAGAGSGKTRSLVKALDRLRRDHAAHLRLRGQKIGVITYTNAACDEIISRIRFDPLFEVRTIHSFAWVLIGGFDHDIREWLRVSLGEAIVELREEERRGRPGTQASRNRLAQIERKQQRLEGLSAVRKFVYSPTGDNRERDALNHSEVIKLCSTFLNEKSTMQRILVNQYPVLLIDESQDTNRELIEALIVVQASHGGRFCMGLLGDTMQRIYGEGKVQIEEALPHDWAKPKKSLNHRCPQRIVKLINKIRGAVDNHEQTARTDKEHGFIRFFILGSDVSDKASAEREARMRMAGITGDKDWGDELKCKTLILEHHMAARRMHFHEMFKPLYAFDDYRTGLLDGSLPAVRFFADQVLPLVKAETAGDKFAVARIVKKLSPILYVETLRNASDQLQQLEKAKLAIQRLMSLVRSGKATFGDVLQSVFEVELFAIPESLSPFCVVSKIEDGAHEMTDDFDDQLSVRQKALAEFLATPFSQIEPYASYIKGEASFDTHQGVKGREFPRVMVIMDDEEARGFLFSYEKLFGAKRSSRADSDRHAGGEETTVDRTRRLFYVTCSRARESLALVAYSDSPMSVRSHLLNSGWCDEEEIVMDLV